MMFSVVTLLLASITLATPIELSTRATSQCSQYQSQSSGAYTLYTNGWGWSSGTGSQCSQIDSLSGSTLAWSTTWSWSGTVNQVKSYTNVETGFTKKQISTYTSMPTTWKWSYTGTDLRVNVAYDTFLGSSANGGNLFEVMVWLGVFGGVSPLSANGYPFTPVATVTIGGTIFDLAYGLNGSVKVYSFVARGGAATNFSADLNLFFKYLLANYASNGFTNSLYLQTVQAGTELISLPTQSIRSRVLPLTNIVCAKATDRDEFTRSSGEIRNLIYEYVLTEDKGVSYYADEMDIGWLCLHDKPTVKTCEVEKEREMPHKGNNTKQIQQLESKRPSRIGVTQREIQCEGKHVSISRGRHIIANQLQFACWQLSDETRGLGLRCNTIRFRGHQLASPGEECASFIQMLPSTEVPHIRVLVLESLVPKKKLQTLLDFCFDHPTVKVHVKVPSLPFKNLLGFVLMYEYIMGKSSPYLDSISTDISIQRHREVLQEVCALKGYTRFSNCPSNFMVYLREEILDPVGTRHAVNNDAKLSSLLSGTPGGLGKVCERHNRQRILSVVSMDGS
ncbi:hypothetical protein HBI56_025760 [Parastagonospora nodorum]|nr:hypothetical protein HBH53_033420 [Parastagonospora nodorum]KAH4200495.1 hypothetical protein HBI95_170360 [Parastagonospora nodorum]KAH4236203.1 hypothetical protein HBI05_134010 [Parastagonospora nodorum]KAH4242349.1 hypothetical protein HBI06_013930 [Parastagonospora nodorum]KAH4254742.1 hypothetical protein HBI03_181610 [Parastagonospora nodorum]